MQEQTIGLRIAEQRKKLGLSQEALGERMGVSRQAISKWESDSAVPEIDKLIALSKLFGVTVGWLLGVEEPQSEEPREEFTETQLKMVEEIVRRYQPRQGPPQPRRWWPKVLGGIAIAIVLISAWSELDQRFNQYASSNSVNNTYNFIQYQLELLTERLDALAEGEKIVTNVSVTATAWEDRGGANIIMTMMPKVWRDGDSAFISARQSGQEIQRFSCTWDGSGYTADISLPAADGYAYYYVVLHADGSQEQQLLDRTGMEDLAEGLKINGYVHLGFAKIQENRLQAHSYNCGINLPKILKPNETSTKIANAYWVLTVNGTECQRESIAEDFFTDNDLDNFQQAGSGQMSFALPETAVTDTVILYLEVQLTDGTAVPFPAVGFQLTGEGWIACEFTDG